MPAGRIEIDRLEETDMEGFLTVVGEINDPFDSEKDYQAWLEANIDVFKRVIGLSGDGYVLSNKTIHGTNLRPDMVFKTKNSTYIVEIKNTRAKYKSHGVRDQVHAISQVLLYKLKYTGDVKVFIVDTCIHEETVSVVIDNKLPITLIEANERHFAILRSWQGKK